MRRYNADTIDCQLKNIFMIKKLLLSSLPIFIIFGVVVPADASAFSTRDIRGLFEDRLCAHLERAYSSRGFSLPSTCEGTEPEPEAPTLTLTADPETITFGGTSTLEWDADNADSCEASEGWAGDKGTSDSEDVMPDSTTTYTLTCEGEGGEITESVTVTVEEEPGPEAPSLTFSASPDMIAPGATSTLEWDAENADTCEADDGWSGEKGTSGSEDVTPATTTLYTLMCAGEGGTTTDSVVVTVETPGPGPAIDHMVISEVFYDVDDAHGSEGQNEWVEIYNGTGASVDMTGWELMDASSSTDAFGTTTLGNGEYMVVTYASTTEGFWAFATGTLVVVLDNNIGNGLGNGGDSLYLLDASSTVIDSVSWGTNTDAFDPAAPDVDEGHSLERNPVTTDTDTAGDWSDQETPNPGE